MLGLGLSIPEIAIRGRRGFSPASLFASGEQGAWFDPSDLNTLRQDSAGTTAVTAVEQPVGLILDKSKGLTGLAEMYRGLSLTPDYWVNAATGNDSNAGTSSGAAWATLSKAASVLYEAVKSGTVVLRVVAGTYDEAGDYFAVAKAVAPANSGLTIVFEPGCVMDGTAAVASVNQNGFEFSCGADWPVTIYGNGLTIQNYANAYGSANGIGNRGSHVLRAYDLTVDNADDGVSAHQTSTIYAYDCTFKNCVKAAFAHVDSSQAYHYRCLFEGRVSAVLGIGANQSSVTAVFEDCRFIPATAGQPIGGGVSMTRCQLGSTTIRVGLVASGTVLDSFLNVSLDTNTAYSFQRCYGKFSARQRNGGSLTMENCVISGPTTGVTNIFYSNFNPGSGSPHYIRNNIFETASAAAFMSYDATNAGYVVAAGSEFFNNVLSGSAAFDADLIAADTGGTVIVGNVTADALIGAGNTLDPADYGYAAGSPAIGAGTGGTNSGFAVGAVAAMTAQQVRGPNGVPGNHAFNPNATTVRPTLSARYNLLTQTEDFSQAVWTDVNVVASGARITANAVTGAAYAEFPFANAPATTLIISFVFPPTPGRHRYVWIADRGVPGIASATFDLDALSVVGANAAATPGISTLSDGSVRCSVTYTRATVGTSSPQFALAGASHTSDRPSLTWVGGEFLDAKADLRVANESATIPYQRVVTATDYDADPTKFPYYLRFDGSDDWLQTASIDFTATDKMSVFAGVRKLSDAATGTVFETSVNSGNNNGSLMLTASGQAAAGAKYGSTLRGTALIYSDTAASYAAPITNVVTLLSDIAQTNAVDEQTMRINGGNVPLTTVGANAGSGNFGNYPLYIGRRGAATVPYNGRLYSLIIRGALTDAATIALAEDYVETKTFGKNMNIVYVDNVLIDGDQVQIDGEDVYVTSRYE